MHDSAKNLKCSQVNVVFSLAKIFKLDVFCQRRGRRRRRKEGQEVRQEQEVRRSVMVVRGSMSSVGENLVRSELGDR